MSVERSRALIVDDEKAIQQLTAVALRNQGFECATASDGEQAEQLLSQSHFDVVITDLRMPNKNGHTFAVGLLKQNPRPLVVIHTGVIDPRLAKDLLARGVDDFILKPADFGIVAAKVKLLVDRAAQMKSRKADGRASSLETDQSKAPEQLPADQPITLSILNTQLVRISSVLPVSNAAMDVYEMTHGENWQVPQIAAAIQRDASLTAEVLRLANNSLYNPSGRRLVDLEEAVLRIGQRRVGELALAASALAALTPSVLPWMDLELAWKRSMAAGIALESLVELGGHHAIEEGLLLSAIMHPLGRVVLGMLFPRHYEAMAATCRETGEPLREQERRAFPTMHTEVMAHLLASWRVPAAVFLPLKYSTDDFSSLARLSEPLRSKTELLKLAIALGRLAVGRWESWDLVQLPPPRVLKRLRIGNVRRVVEQTRSDLAKLADFHPGEPAPKRKKTPPTAEQNVAYCNPADASDDLLIELLPSLGLKPKEYPIEELQHAEEAVIINCLGPTSGRFAGLGGWSASIIVAEHENREIFEPFAETISLPDTYGRIRELLLSAVIGHGASERQGAVAACS